MKKIPLIGAFFSHKLFQGYGFAVIISVLLHILILGLLSRNWSSDDELRVVPPRSIKASVVEVSQPKPKPPASKPVVDNSAQKARELAEQKRKQEARRQAEIKKQKELALKKEQAAKEKARKEEAARKERERKQRQAAEQKRKKQQQEELLRQLEQERVAREQAQAAADEQAEKDAGEVAYYSELLQNLIAQNWNRPPSARNNMVALVQLSFSPYGDLLEVRLLEGSGNDAYDRSVIQAIQRAAPFPELKKLERRVFDNNFKRVNFRFRPEDLVR
ncbi:cell envelope integrity protein TolA [Endozoicomonas arenosclerae]|uniref:cell envelope integrity protein TolA n=1 Tax=Endozoicomonas arenosclerae TaxID=1633495 RepID=UPI0007856B34|nr:cell envelope integrity protein TolA [Endozoicomonas arenosclerae]